MIVDRNDKIQVRVVVITVARKILFFRWALKDSGEKAPDFQLAVKPSPPGHGPHRYTLWMRSLSPDLGGSRWTLPQKLCDAVCMSSFVALALTLAANSKKLAF